MSKIKTHVHFNWLMSKDFLIGLVIGSNTSTKSS